MNNEEEIIKWTTVRATIYASMLLILKWNLRILASRGLWNYSGVARRANGIIPFD